MAHFAKVDQGRVVDVISASQEFIDNFEDTTPGTWIQTSYNTIGGVHFDPDTKEPSADQSKALRKNYAYIGGWYHYQDDAFYSPQPYPSWTLNTNSYVWEAPVEHPGDGQYTWNEETQSWDAV